MKKRELIYCIVFIFAGILVYANSFANGFVWDDRSLILLNGYIKDWRHIPDIFSANLIGGIGQASAYYRPLQAVSYMIDYHIWKLDPFGYHITNLIFHIANAILIYLLFKMLAGNNKAAFLTGLLFVVHPIHTEAVTYISGRAEPMAAFFILGSLISYIKYISSPERKNVFYTLSLISFIFALLSKEIALLLPFALMLYDGVFRREISFRAKFSNYLLFFVVAAAYLSIRKFAIGLPDANPSIEAAPLFLRMLTGIKVIFLYIGLLVLPLGLHMQRTIQPANSLFEPAAFASLLGLGLIAVFMLRAYRSSKITFWAAGWFFLMLMPVLNIVPLKTFMAEHWLYLPSIGFFSLVSPGIIKLVDSDSTIVFGRAIMGGIAIVFSFYAILTFNQNFKWRDDVALYSYLLDFSPESASLHFNLGNAYERRGLGEKALSEYRRAIALNPDNKDARSNLGSLYYEMGESGKAIEEYKKILQIDSRYVDAYNNLGNIYASSGQYDKAVDMFKQALSIDSGLLEAHYNLGLLYLKRQLYDKAKAEFEKALKIEPDFEKARQILSHIYEEERAK